MRDGGVMAAEAKFRLVGEKELVALQWAAKAVSAIPCPANCLNGSLSERIASGEWVEVECEWCAMEKYLQAAAEGNYDIKGEHPDPLLDDFCMEEPEPLEHDETTGTGSDWCEYCRHHWGNHIDHSYEDGGHVGCVLADCDCEESPMIVRPTSTPAPIPQEARPEPPEQDERGQGPQIHELVAADLAHRDSSGAEELMMSSSDCEIDTLEHAYQETLDLALYLRRLIWEWKCVMGSDGSV